MPELRIRLQQQHWKLDFSEEMVSEFPGMLGCYFLVVNGVVIAQLLNQTSQTHSLLFSRRCLIVLDRYGSRGDHQKTQIPLLLLSVFLSMWLPPEGPRWML